MPTPDLISRAARFFVLAEQAFRLFGEDDQHFWDMSTSLAVEPVLHLPAMAAAVRTAPPLNHSWPRALWIFAHQPLPAMLLPKAVPWHDHLVAALEVHRASSSLFRQNVARLVLVRLDGCRMPDGYERPSRLREWLANAQTMAGTVAEPARAGEWRVPYGGPDLDWEAYLKMEPLASLAAWRPASRVITPPETLREWVNFWLKIQQSNDPVEKGIASIALLNLPEADLRAASIPPVPTTDLLRQITTAIQAAAKRIDPDYLSLLDWQPVEGTTWPATEVRNVAQAWLKLTKRKAWRHRRDAWRQLIRWNRTGSLSICGVDLLPELVKAVPTEKDARVLWEMAQWVPSPERFTATGMPDGLSLLQQLETVWEQYRTSKDSGKRAAAWLAGLRLHQAGLAVEPPETFLQAYLSGVASEWNDSVLLIFAQWSPGTDAPDRWHRDWHAAWQQRLLDNDEHIRQVAACALLDQPLEKKHDRSLRCAALELWRAGTRASSEARPTLDALFARFQEVRARLAAGEVPDFEKKLSQPAERCRPPLALPPGRIADNEWKMENEELKMNNGKWKMKHQKATSKPPHHLVTDSPFSRGGF